uniref:F-box domain-containing protein n=1 Tax=Oryza barthii TaxID=65489 RepID=A0A0D3F623_9ORYZ
MTASPRKVGNRSIAAARAFLLQNPRRFVLRSAFGTGQRSWVLVQYFQNAPTFRELETWSFPRPEAFRRKRTWDQDQTEIEEPTLHHLVTVIINDFVGLDCEVALVGLLLSWTSEALRSTPSRRRKGEERRGDPLLPVPLFDNCEVTIIVPGAMHRAKKAKVEPSSALRSDKFSILPQEIKVTILSKLNSLDAIRASILSSAWRNVWTTLPEIYLCDLYLSWGSSETTQRSKFITLVDLALLLHNGPLASFSILGFKRYHDVHAVKEKTKIKRCIIGLPQEFEGFKRLTVLNLKYFSSTDSDINNLISSCPLLSTFIQAPALQDLEVKGNFQDFHLHAPNLSNLSVTLDKTEAQQSVVVEGNRKNYLKQAMVSLTSIVRLVMKRCIIALPQEFEGFKQLFVLNLKYFSSTDHDINTLISSCPCLNTLCLKHFDGISYLRIEGQVLQIVEVEGKFEDFHLNAPNLSHVYITLDKTEAQ